MKARILLVIVMVLALVVPVALTAGSAYAAPAAPPDINGGASWGGWMYRGQSDQLGVYSTGNNGTVWKIYTVVFAYNSSNPIAGGAYGGFADGNKILGIGIERVSGTGQYAVVGFDLDKADFTPSTTLTPPGNGHSNFPYQDNGDPIAHFPNSYYGGQPSEVTVVKVDGSGNFIPPPPPGSSNTPCGSFGCGTGLPGIRGQSAAPGKSQMFFDLTYMPTYYTSLGGFQEDDSFWINIDGAEAVVALIPELSLSTTNNLICGATTATVDVKLANVVNLYGYEFQVSYDQTKVSAVGAWVNSFFDTADPASKPWNATCAAGVCKFSVSHTGGLTPTPQQSVSGSGPLAKIVLTALPLPTPGTIAMAISGDVLTDINGGALIHTLGAALPPITVCGLATITGNITLQGRFSGNVDPGTVTMIEQAPTSFAAVAPVPFSGTNGAYSIQVPYLPGGSNYKIRAEHGLYLGNEETFLVNGSLANKNTQLWGGDANNDARVSIGDLSCIGAAFGISPIVSDCGGTGSPNINADAKVNVQDLSITGGNYDKCSYQPWNTALPGNYNCPTPLTGRTVVSSPALSFGDGGWGGWSCPAGKVIVGGGFEATAPVAVSAPGTPGSVWPHYTFGVWEYGWVVRDAPDGVPNTITIRPICADPPPGYQVVKSSSLGFSGTGWGGWSCPLGKVVTGGGFAMPGTVLAAAPGTPGSIWLHYTYGANEWGWVVQAGGAGPGFVYAICASPVAGYEVAGNATAWGVGDSGWGGWSCPASKKITGGGFQATAPVSVSAPATPGSIWPHYTYGANEYGWVMRDYPDSVGSTTKLYSVCVAP